MRRREPDPPPPDFEFPQMDSPQFAEPGWHPRLFDYLYVSFTNSIAFCPTDTMPLTRRAKALMLMEAAASASTVLLVAARAVNILGLGGRRGRHRGDAGRGRAGGGRHARGRPAGPKEAAVPSPAPTP